MRTAPALGCDRYRAIATVSFPMSPAGFRAFPATGPGDCAAVSGRWMKIRCSLAAASLKKATRRGSVRDRWIPSKFGAGNGNERTRAGRRANSSAVDPAREHGAGQRGGAVDGRHRGERGVHDALPGVVDCLANTTTTNSTNTNGATNPSSDRVQEFNNSANITATIAARQSTAMASSSRSPTPGPTPSASSTAALSRPIRTSMLWSLMAMARWSHISAPGRSRLPPAAAMPWPLRTSARAASRSLTTASSARSAITAFRSHDGPADRRHHR